MTKEEIEQATNVAVKLSEHLDAKEQAMFVAGFQTCIKWLSENERLKSELLGNPEQLKVERDKILDEVKAEIVEKFDSDPMVRRISNMVINEIKSRITP